MGMKIHLLVLSLASIILFFSTSAICVRHDATTQQSDYPESSYEAPAEVDSSDGSAQQTVSLKGEPAPAGKPGGGGGGGGIKELCDKTEEPILCTALAPPDTKADPASLLRFFIKTGRDKAQAALDTSKKITGDHPSNNMIAKSMTVCVASYDDTVTNYDSAATALDGNDHGTLMTMLSGALSGIDTCATGFSELPGIAGPMTAQNDEIIKISKICLALGDSMK